MSNEDPGMAEYEEYYGGGPDPDETHGARVPSMIMRWRYRQLGEHIHVRVFITTSLSAAKSGDLVFRESEWDYIQTMLKDSVEFVPEIEIDLENSLKERK